MGTLTKKVRRGASRRSKGARVKIVNAESSVSELREYAINNKLTDNDILKAIHQYELLTDKEHMYA